MTPTTEYYDERLREKEDECLRLEERLGEATSRIAELEGIVAALRSQLNQCAGERATYFSLLPEATRKCVRNLPPPMP